MFDSFIKAAGELDYIRLAGGDAGEHRRLSAVSAAEPRHVQNLYRPMMHLWWLTYLILQRNVILLFLSPCCFHPCMHDLLLCAGPLR